MPSLLSLLHYVSWSPIYHHFAPLIWTRSTRRSLARSMRADADAHHCLHHHRHSASARPPRPYHHLHAYTLAPITRRVRSYSNSSCRRQRKVLMAHPSTSRDGQIAGRRIPPRPPNRLPSHRCRHPRRRSSIVHSRSASLTSAAPDWLLCRRARQVPTSLQQRRLLLLVRPSTQPVSIYPRDTRPSRGLRLVLPVRAPLE